MHSTRMACRLETGISPHKILPGYHGNGVERVICVWTRHFIGEIRLAFVHARFPVSMVAPTVSSDQIRIVFILFWFVRNTRNGTIVTVTVFSITGRRVSRHACLCSPSAPTTARFRWSSAS